MEHHLISIFFCTLYQEQSAAALHCASCVVHKVIEQKNKNRKIVLRDPGTICMHTILTRAPLIIVFQWPSGMRKIWVDALNFPPIFYLQFFNILYHFSHRVHQLPNYLSEYKVVAIFYWSFWDKLMRNDMPHPMLIHVFFTFILRFSYTQIIEM